MIRYEFTDTSINEANVHPDSIFARERELARVFVSNMTSEKKTDRCPVSGKERDEVLFGKWGQKYALCPETWSLSLASLPNKEILREYYYTSELAKFRSSQEYQEVASRLRKSLWENQIEWIEGRVRRYLGMDSYNITDWGCKSSAWSEHLKQAAFVKNIYNVDPLPPVVKNLTDSTVDIICLVDVLQRTIRPHELFNNISSKLRPGGLLIITCRSGSGLDVLTLREQSDTIFPLDHICLPSPQGVQLLIEKAGLEMLELATPGLLDIQFIKNAGKAVPHDQYFQRYIIEQRDDALLERLQSFLQQNNLSSHIRAVAQKPEN